MDTVGVKRIPARKKPWRYDWDDLQGDTLDDADPDEPLKSLFRAKSVADRAPVVLNVSAQERLLSWREIQLPFGADPLVENGADVASSHLPRLPDEFSESGYSVKRRSSSATKSCSMLCKADLQRKLGKLQAAGALPAHAAPAALEHILKTLGMRSFSVPERQPLVSEKAFLELVDMLRHEGEEEERHQRRAAVLSSFSQEPPCTAQPAGQQYQSPKPFRFPIKLTSLECVQTTELQHRAQKTLVAGGGACFRRTSDLDNGRRAASEDSSVRLSTHFRRFIGPKGPDPMTRRRLKLPDPPAVR